MVLINEIQFIDGNNGEYIIVNLITGAADIVEEPIYKHLKAGNLDLEEPIIDALLERRYIFKDNNEYQEFINDINERISVLEESATPNFVLIPSYSCNLCCTYCYEQTYSIENNSSDKIAIIDKQFSFIKAMISNFDDPKDIRVTIMGGEPLLVAQYDAIEYLINCATKQGYSIDIVTNGVDLNVFVPLLINPVVDHIQVTLDGVKDVHDKRRIFHNGAGSFDRIIKNIQIALNNHINVYLRVNLDAENIDSLPLLAKLLSTLDNGNYLYPYIYLLQDGGCSGDSNVIRELSGIDQIYELEQKYSEVSIFSKRYHPIHLINSIFNNEKFSPCLRHCGASGNQYILDCNGYIYKCWHGIGNKNYACGQYIPQIEWNDSIIKWKRRSTLNIIKCQNCKYRYICGTGCPAAKHSGTDCFDIEKESCADYEVLIDKLIKLNLK